MSADVDLISRAAALMRERAEAAQNYDNDLSWTCIPTLDPANSGWVVTHEPSHADYDTTVAQAIYDYEGHVSRHIASWHPGMALAVADWLEDVAKDWDENTTIDSPEVGDYMPPAPEATWCDWCGGAINSERYSTPDQRCDCYRWPRALAVARTYLKEQS